jgi:hypothetical protein
MELKLKSQEEALKKEARDKYQDPKNRNIII